MIIIGRERNNTLMIICMIGMSVSVSIFKRMVSGCEIEVTIFVGHRGPLSTESNQTIQSVVWSVIEPSNPSHPVRIATSSGTYITRSNAMDHALAGGARTIQPRVVGMSVHRSNNPKCQMFRGKTNWKHSLRSFSYIFIIFPITWGCT